MFNFRPLYDGHIARHGELLLTSRAVAHDVEAYGLRVTDGQRVLAYSGDTGPCAGLTELARDADLFLCEADIDAHREGEQVHLTPEDAAEAARAAAAFGGRTETAREGRTRAV